MKETVVIHTPTIRLFNKVLDKIKKEGYTIGIDNSSWIGEEMCVSLNFITRYSVGYSNYVFYTDMDIKPIPAYSYLNKGKTFLDM